MSTAARTSDTTSHGSPLSPGPGSTNVLIGKLAAWRALPSGVGAGLESASNAMSTLMSSPTLTPVDATVTLAQVQAGLAQAASAAATEGNAAAVVTTSSSMATLTATNATLTATYTAACAVPGGAAAATTAYTEGIKAAAAAAASAAVTAIAGTTDMHNCPMPCGAAIHGPGVVTQGSKSVFINKLPAVRQGDNVYEACGGADAIAISCTNVFIGDAGGAGATSTSPATDEADEAASEAAVQTALEQLADVQAAATVAAQNTAAALSGKALCELCEASHEA